MPRSKRAVVIGGGHNGLVCAAYLARNGVETTLVEKRAVLGGMVGSFEYMPGYRAALTNSPGSFESRVSSELELERHGLEYVRPRITVAQRFGDRTFLGFRDRSRIATQIDAFARGEYKRYRTLIDELNALGRATGWSLWKMPDSIETVRSHLTDLAQRRLFDEIIEGTLFDFLESRLRADETRSILTMLALPGTLVSPRSPGSALTLLMRPISMASLLPGEDDTASSLPLRGSVGTPIGSMSAIIDALESAAREAGVRILTGSGAERILKDDSKVSGVRLSDGAVIEADKIVSTIEPSLLQSRLLEDPADLVPGFEAQPPKGAAFKLAIALDGVPEVPGLPEDVSSREVLGSQIRIAKSTAYIEASIQAGIAGRPSEEPIMWGMIPSIVSPKLAPPGRHFFSVNVWHAPHELGAEYWRAHRDSFANRCLHTLEDELPGITNHVVEMSSLTPIDLENEFSLTGSEITHGVMTPDNFFDRRIHPSLADRRAELDGLYLGGSESWPGGYVTGAPGRNAAHAVIRDLEKTPVHI